MWQHCASVSTFLSSVRLWSVWASDTEGCIDLVAPVALADGVDIASGTYPVMLLLEELGRRGWTGHDPQLVAWRAQKRYCRKRVEKRRSYSEVLLKIDALPLGGIWSDQLRA